MSEDKTIQTILLNVEDKIKVVQYGDSSENLQLFHSYEKDGELKWRFRGYHQSIRHALEYVVRNEVLVDYSTGADIHSYVEAVKEANDKIYKTLVENQND